MLQNTLGCPDTFELRRQELSLSANSLCLEPADGSASILVSDEMVTDSFTGI